MHELLEQAILRLDLKGREHNQGTITFRDYCPFGLKSAATFVHREALRVCMCIAKGDSAGVREHLIDVVVFSMLMWDNLCKLPEEEQPKVQEEGVCPYFREDCICVLSNKSVASMWLSMCKGIGLTTWRGCSTYKKEEKK